MASSPGAAPLPLRRLLALARDLLQAPDLRSVLELVGPAFQELLAPDNALLLVTLGEQEYATAFDRRGLLLPADHDSLLYRAARQTLAEQAPLIVAEQDNLLALPFPPTQPVGVFAAHWHRKGNRQWLDEQATLLRYLSELTGAALGNVDFRLVLEEEVSARSAEIRAVAEQHAQEIQRRNVIDMEKDRIAVTDVLTGMLNRRGFFLHAEQAFKVAHREGKPCAVIFADIDGLKAVNDELGHDMGDRLIQAGAQILQASFRDSDVVARLGGDEFAAFTVAPGQPEAILARIRENADLFHRRASTPYRVSFSTGIVQCNPASDLSLEDYLSQADKEMYKQKKGHNQ